MTRAPSEPLAHLLIALFLTILSAYPTKASSQNTPKSTSACPSAADMDHQHLQGVWRAELQATAPGTHPTVVTLQLGPHPELAQSVRGTALRQGLTAQVSGDVDAGELNLEESTNGTSISATWTGRVVNGSCGKEIQGTWNNANPTPAAPSAPFVLRRQAAWQ